MSDFLAHVIDPANPPTFPPNTRQGATLDPTGALRVVGSTSSGPGGPSGSVTAAGTAGTTAQAIQGIPGGVPMPISGSITATNPSVAVRGAAAPGSATMLGMLDNTGNLVAIGIGTALPVVLPAGVTFGQGAAGSTAWLVQDAATRANDTGGIRGQTHDDQLGTTNTSLATVAGAVSASKMQTVDATIATSQAGSGLKIVQNSTIAAIDTIALTTAATAQQLPSVASALGASIQNQSASDTIYVGTSNAVTSTGTHGWKLAPGQILGINATNLSAYWWNGPTTASVLAYTVN